MTALHLTSLWASGPGPQLAFPPATGKDLLSVRVLAVRVFDDAGSNGTVITKQAIVNAVENGNIHLNKAGIRLVIDSEKDIIEVHDTLLNNDFSLAPGATLDSPENRPPATEGGANWMARRQFAREHFGRLVWFFQRGSALSYDKGKKQWAIVPRGHSYSGMHDNYISFCGNWNSLSPDHVAHEAGHYFHLAHTFGWTPNTREEWVAAVKEKVDKHGWSRDAMVEMFDGDAFTVSDTPPDPGPAFMRGPLNEPCGSSDSIDVPVEFADGTKKAYVVSPNRKLLMSYFKGCFPTDESYSPEQIERMRRSLLYGNRAHLLKNSKARDWLPPAPAIASWGHGRFDVFPVGGDAGVAQKVMFSDRRWYPAAMNAFHAIGAFASGEISVVGRPRERLDLFARGIDGFLWHKRFNGRYWEPDNVRQVNWKRLGASLDAKFGGDPTAVLGSDDEIHVFIRSEDGELMHLTYSDGAEKWESLGGEVKGKPAVVFWPERQRIDVFVRDAEGYLSHNVFADSWSGWNAVKGETIVFDPSAVRVADNRLDVFVTSALGEISQKTWIIGKGWKAWRLLGGKAMSKPIAVVARPNRIDLLIRGADDQIWALSTADSKKWGGWTAIGGQTHTHPGVISVAPGLIDVVIWGQDSGLWHKSLEAPLSGTGFLNQDDEWKALGVVGG